MKEKYVKSSKIKFVKLKNYFIVVICVYISLLLIFYGYKNNYLLEIFTGTRVDQHAIDNSPSVNNALVIDRDGDGVFSKGLDHGVHFDHNADGVAEQTGSIHSSDGFLALDLNNNGTIDSGSELFGNNTINLESLKEGNPNKADNGYQALSNYDSNHDGVIDKRDPVFKKLMLWEDIGGYKIDYPFEMTSMEDASIVSISLDARQRIIDLKYGNWSKFSSDVELSYPGKASLFSVDLILGTGVIERNVDIDESLKDFPNIKGSGFSGELIESASLHKPLSDLLKEAVAAPTRTQRIDIIDKIILEWAKSANTFDDFYERTEQFRKENIFNFAPIWFGYDNGRVDTKWDKLAITEVFSGKKLREANYTTYFANVDFTGVNDFYNKQKSFVLTSIEDQSVLQPYKKAVFPKNSFNEMIPNVVEDIFEKELVVNQEKAISDFLAFTGYYYKDLVKAGYDPKPFISKRLSQIDLSKESKIVISGFGVKIKGIETEVIELFGKGNHYLNDGNLIEL